MKKILCYNEDCCDFDGFDNVADHPDATIIELANETEYEIVQTMIQKIHYATRRRSIASLIFELKSLYDVRLIELYGHSKASSRFDELFSAITENEFVDFID